MSYGFERCYTTSELENERGNDMSKSLKEYIVSLGIWGWVVLVDIISSAVGGYLDVSGTVNVPAWLWFGLLIIGLIVAPFIAFHKIRIQRDNISKDFKDQEWEYRRKRLIELREPYLEPLPIILRDMSKQLPLITEKIVKNLPVINDSQLQEISTYIYNHTSIHNMDIEENKKIFAYFAWALESNGVGLKQAKQNDPIWCSLNRQYYDSLTSITDGLLKDYLQTFLIFLDGNCYYTLFGAYIDKSNTKKTLDEKIKNFGSIDGREKIFQDILANVNRRIEQLRSGDNANQ